MGACCVKSSNVTEDLRDQEGFPSDDSLNTFD